ncbi:MAG: response regulator, partial [Phycicoccus sp.]
MVVDAQEDMRVVGQAADGAQALDVVAVTPCDLVLMDVRMPNVDGVAATRELVRRHPERPRVVVLTTFDLDEHAFAALRAGASGFLLKDATAEDVVAAIRTVHA